MNFNTICIINKIFLKNTILNDIVEMKKQHPCGTNRWQITRMGADIKIKCLKCDNNIMMPRREFNKKIKKIIEKNS